MDFKKILGKLDSIEPITESKTNETLSLDSGPGAKFPGYWKGTDKGMPGNKLVGSKKNKETKIISIIHCCQIKKITASIKINGGRKRVSCCF